MIEIGRYRRFRLDAIEQFEKTFNRPQIDATAREAYR